MENRLIRLQKILTPVASRRKAENYIAAGRVTVNGVTARLGDKADPATDEILLDGLPINQPADAVYLMLHKPERVMTTAHDPQGRTTILDLLPAGTRCFPVGRLDYDTAGLLLLTSDGDLAYRLTHPKHEVKKTYAAHITGVPTPAALAAFRRGILLDGQPTAPCDIQIIRTGKTQRQPNTLVHITLHEGRNRQVRKMCEAIGHPVLRLKRISVGGLVLGNLAKGAWRNLSEEEIRLLHNL